jgi:bifunctional non-homologous end joining protein LigD
MRSDHIEPCLPTPAKTPPAGPDWLHEIKHDGFRILALRDAAVTPAMLQRYSLPIRWAQLA